MPVAAVEPPVGSYKLPARGLLIGAGLGIVAVAALPLTLGCLGFGLTGVALGSWAASIQGAAIVAGSPFAVAQSIAAVGGLSAMAGTGVVAVGAVVGGAAEVVALAPKHCRLCGRVLPE